MNGTDDLARDFLSRGECGAPDRDHRGHICHLDRGDTRHPPGRAAAYLGGLADAISGRLIDVAQSVPTIMLVTLVNTAVKKAVTNLFDAAYQATGFEFFKGIILLDYLITLAAIASVSWPVLYAAHSRRDLVAARARLCRRQPALRGCLGLRILLRHIVPNALGPIIVAGTFGFSTP